MTDREYLAELVDIVRDLAGAIIDNMPPDTQHQIADAQVELIRLARRLEESV